MALLQSQLRTPKQGGDAIADRLVEISRPVQFFIKVVKRNVEPLLFEENGFLHPGIQALWKRIA